MNDLRVETRIHRQRLARMVALAKKIKGVHIVFVNFEGSCKSAQVWTRDLEFVFVNENLNRRQRGRQIRRGIEFLEKRRRDV